MASETLTERPLDTAMVQFGTDATVQSGPIEALQIEEPNNEEENIAFPTGPKLWSTMASMCIALFLSGLVNTLLTNIFALLITILAGHHHCRRRCTKHNR